jgi:hypothetical protein
VGEIGRDQPGGNGEEDLGQVPPGPCDLSSGQRVESDLVQSAGQSLSGPGQCVVPGGSGDDEAPGGGALVQLSFDRIEQNGYLLIFVDAYRWGTRHKDGRIRRRRLSSGYIVQIHDLDLLGCGDRSDRDY